MFPKSPRPGTEPIKLTCVYLPFAPWKFPVLTAVVVALRKAGCQPHLSRKYRQLWLGTRLEASPGSEIAACQAATGKESALPTLELR